MTWTMKQLEMGDIDFVICILNERRNRLTNDYSPLAQKLAQAVRTLEKLRK